MSAIAPQYSLHSQGMSRHISGELERKCIMPVRFRYKILDWIAIDNFVRMLDRHRAGFRVRVREEQGASRENAYPRDVFWSSAGECWTVVPR